MRIGIDARFYGRVGKGLGRYLEQLITHLEKIDQHNQYFIFLRRKNYQEYHPQQDNFHKVLADYHWYGFAEQFCLPIKIAKTKIDLMHFPHFNVPIFYFGKFVVTIHDLITSHFSTCRASTKSKILYRLKHLVYQFVIYLAIHRAQQIISVSNFTKQEVKQEFKIKSKKITVIYEGVSKLINRDKQVLLNKQIIFKKYFINKPYFLYVGNAYPHKNLTKLLTAFKLFSQRQKYQLVLVGKNDFFYQRLKTLAKQRNLLSQRSIIFTGFVPDDELAILYQQCQAYIFPSLYEGFGLPPLEAMAQQAPVIAARAGSLPEILGPAALYFDPQQESNIVQVMEQLVDDDSLKQQLIINGNQQIKKYSWTYCAQQTLSIYQQTIKNK